MKSTVNGLVGNRDVTNSEFDAVSEEILAVIEAETAAWLNRDLEAWAKCWVHEDYARRIASRAFGGAEAICGFSEHRSRLAGVMASFPVKSTKPSDVRREKLNIRVGSDMAWVTFEQVILSRDIPDGTKGEPGVHHQMRILEKHDGRWLIAALSEVQTRLGFLTCPWVHIDAKTRVLDINNSAETKLRDHPALTLVGGRLVGRTRANSVILRETIDTHLMAPSGHDSNSPYPMLFFDTKDDTISLCWLSTDDEMLVVLLDDEELTRETIRRAKDIYGLTEAQERVALAISGGQDLTQAARTLGVQPNTVRTHVKRMFEKAGVRSQAALMRKLLSIAAPGLRS